MAAWFGYVFAFVGLASSAAVAAGDAVVVNWSEARQAIVLRDPQGLRVLVRDQVDDHSRIRLRRVDQQGAELEFLDLKDGALIVRVTRGTDLGVLRAQLEQRPTVPATIEVAIPLDPATGQPLKSPQARRPAAVPQESAQPASDAPPQQP